MSGTATTPAPGTGAARSPEPRPSPWQDGLLLGGRTITMMTRRPASLMGALVFPLLFFLLFLTVFGATMERIGVDYVQYLVPAIVIQAMFFTAMSSALLTAEDAASGMLSRLRSMPVARSAPLTGILCADLCRAAVSLTVLVVAGVVLGFRFDAGPAGAAGFLALVLLFLLVAVAAYSALGLGLRSVEAVQAVLFLPYFPLLMVSTCFAPATVFPGWLQPVVRHSPISETAAALRALTAGGPTLRPVVGAAIWLVTLLIVFTVLASRAFGKPR